MKNFRKNEIGITLIALVITVIVLLILAGVTIATLTGDNGILTRTQEAKEETEQAQKDEENILKSYEDTINEYAGIDWDTVLANAEMHPNQKTSTAIGVGTDGRAVNMDLWEYNFDDVTNGYGLNDSTSLVATASADASKGYTGMDFDNIVIPQYISTDEGESWTAVTNLDWLFYNCTELEKINKLPDTVKSMRFTFRGCENLSEVLSLPKNLENMGGTFMSCTSLKIAPSIPKNVTNMESTFSQCTSLKEASEIPSNVTSLYFTFNQCQSLVIAPEIPDNVINMQLTFYNCTSLEKGPSKIPSSVTNFYDTFYGCSKLNGIMEINASITGANVNNDKFDYAYCFVGAATESGTSLILRCTENVYNLFYDESRSNKINNDVCRTDSNIILEKK